MAFLPNYAPKDKRPELIQYLCKIYSMFEIEDPDVKRHIAFLLKMSIDNFFKEDKEKLKELYGFIDMYKDDNDLKILVHDVYKKELQELDEECGELKSFNDKIKSKVHDLRSAGKLDLDDFNYLNQFLI